MSVFFPDPNKKIFVAGGKSRKPDNKVYGPGKNDYGRDSDPSKIELPPIDEKTREKFVTALKDIADAKKITGKKQTQERIAIFGYDPIIHAPF